MQGDLISVVMPVYNTEELLPEAVDSVRRQTYTNWELMLIDDGSTDASAEMCDAYARMDPRIRAVHLSHAGVSYARNYGIDHAAGTWVYFMDSDDWLELNAFETLLRHAGDADMVMGGYPIRTRRDQNRLGEAAAFYPGSWTYGEREAFGLHHAVYAVWDKLYRRECLKVRFHEDMNRWEDTCYNLEMLPYWRKVVLLPEQLYHYRQFYSHSTLSHQVSISQIPLLRRRYDLFHQVFGDIPELAARNNSWYIREMWEFFAVISIGIRDEALRLSITQMCLADEALVRITDGMELLKPYLHAFWKHVLEGDAGAINDVFILHGGTEEYAGSDNDD